MKRVTIASVEQYVKGSNSLLDSINPDDKIVWCVQGNLGRIPIIALTEEEAREKYRNKKRAVIEDEESAAD